MNTNEIIDCNKQIDNDESTVSDLAGNMKPLTGDDAGVIRRGDRWLLILVRSNFKKFSKVVSKRPDFGH